MPGSFLQIVRSFRRNERGIASIEFIIILPVILLMLAVVTDVGRMLMDYHAVTKSVRDAGRYLSRVYDPDTVVGWCGSPTIDMTTTEAQNAMRLVLTGKINGNPQTEPLVKAWTPSALTAAATNISISAECMANSGLTNGPYSSLAGFYDGEATIPAIRVRAEVPFNFKLAGVLGIGPTIDMKITHKMAHIGQ